MIVKYLKIFIVLLLASVLTSSALAEVKAYLNQSSFYDGDPITLKIESTQKNGTEPNLTPLEKDFTVLGVGSSSQSFSINGKHSFLKSWTIELQPNRKGSLQIPAIAVGKEKTEPLNFKVVDLPPEVTAETKKHVFLETSIGIEGNTTFVQQQIPYTVKLFYDPTMQTAEMITPDLNMEIENAIVEKLGQNKRYQVVRAGKRYNVVEKNFVISPEKSGPLKIPATIVKGRIALSGGDSQKLRQRMDGTDMLNNFFNDFNDDAFFRDSFRGGFFSRRAQGPSKPFTIKGKAIEVDVLPIAKEFSGSAWLPAEELVIKDSWAKNPPELKAGEPITRILTLQAKGLAGSQIPDIQIPKPNKMRVYPEKAKSETATDGSTVYGIQNINISYIPDASGKVTIPEIKVDWWDVKNKKQRTFIVPRWNLNIAPDPTIKTTKADVNTAFNKATTEQLPSTLDIKSDTVDDNSAETSKRVVTWKGMFMVALLLLGSVGLLYSLRKYLIHNKTVQQKTSKHKQSRDIATVRTSLIQACKNNEKRAAAKYLLEFAQLHWNDDSLQNLGMIATQLKQANDIKIIKDLEQNLYSPKPKAWNGEPLANLIENRLPQKQKKKQRSNNELAPLYPA